MVNKKLFFLFVLLSLFALLQNNTLAGEKDSSFPYDFRGVKLGMNINEVKQLLPTIRFSEFNDYRNKNTPARFSGSVSYDFNTSAIQIKIADEPYGEGVYHLYYREILWGNQRKDAPTFISNFRKDLINKYKKPIYEKIDEKNNYFACWASTSDCKLGISPPRIHLEYLLRDALLSNEIRNGKYLIVTFRKYSSSQRVEFSLFDMNPYNIQIKEKKKREQKSAQEKIKF